jgi:hypothetical protein
MIDARNYSAHGTLKNGLRVTIRAIGPDDKVAITAAFKELYEKTICPRFFGPKREISCRELTEVT